MSLNIKTSTGLLEIGDKVTKLDVFTFAVQQNKYSIKEANNGE